MSASLSLAWRFARGADKRGRTIAAIGVLGIAFGVAALLGGLSVVPALEARDARQARNAGFVSSAREDDVLLMETWRTTFHDQVLQVQYIAPVGDAPMPGGLNGFPAPGTIVASPDLAAILRGPERGQLAERLPGTLVGEIGQEGLVEPNELRAYVGAVADDLRGAISVTRFGAPDPYPTDPGVMAAIAAATAGVIVSVLVFVWTVTRLGAASRESRLAALRLLGATPTQVRLTVALEVGIGALVGAVAGVLLFGVGRTLVPWEAFLPGDTGLFPADLRPPLGQVLLVFALVPFAAVAVAWTTLRRAVGKPMEVTRRAPVRSLGVVLGAAALTLGVAGWVAMASEPALVSGEDGYLSPQGAVYFGAWAMTALGVLGVAPWLGTRGAALVMRKGGLGAWFASRRLSFDRRSAGRIAAGVVAVVFAAGTSTGILHLYAAQRGLTTSADNLQVTALLASGGRSGQAARVGGNHGVTGSVPVSFAQAKIRGWGPQPVAVADCAALGSVLREVPPCDAGIWRTTLEGQIDPRQETITIRGPDQVDATFAIPPEDAPTIDLSFLGGYPVFMIDRAALDPALASWLDSFEAMLVADGDPDTAEAIRESLGAGSTVAITTPTMYEPYGWSQEAGIARAVQWAASVAVAIAAASLLVALVGAIHERRRPLAVLAASGVPAGTIRRSYLLQAMLPLAAGVLLALGCAAIVVRSYAAIDYDGVGAWAAMLPGLRIAAVALLGGLLATALTLPAIGRSVAPEALHAE